MLDRLLDAVRGGGGGALVVRGEPGVGKTALLAVPLSESIAESFRLRLDGLPADTHVLLQLAAADPVGNLVLVWRAARLLGIRTQAATPAAEAGLLEVGAPCGSGIPCCGRRVTGLPHFTSGRTSTAPWLRSLIQSSTLIAPPGTGPWPPPSRTRTSRPSWSARLAGPKRRGGLAAAAAFLERAAMLTPDPTRRVCDMHLDALCVRYDGITNDFVMLSPLRDTDATRAALAQPS